MTQVVDFIAYKATRVIVEWGDDLGQALHDLDKANRAVEATLKLFKPKMARFYKGWWPDGAA